MKDLFNSKKLFVVGGVVIAIIMIFVISNILNMGQAEKEPNGNEKETDPIVIAINEYVKNNEDLIDWDGKTTRITLKELQDAELIGAPLPNPNGGNYDKETTVISVTKDKDKYTYEIIQVSLANKVVKQMTAGNLHTVFLLEDGTVLAAGSNDYGKLGNGTVSIKSEAIQPMKNASTYLTEVKSISTGAHHTVFLLKNGTVWAVGSNGQGQLGNGTKEEPIYPTQVKKDANTYLTGVKAISASGMHTVFLLENGTVWAVGFNKSGQLGIGTAGGANLQKSYAVQVKKDANTPLTKVKSIASGSGHTVFLLEDGTAWVVGSYSLGELGDGTIDSKTTYPVQVKKDANTPLTNIKSIVARYSQTFYLLEDGTVWAVGANKNGQLGDGTTKDKAYLVNVKKDATTPLTKVKSIEAGPEHTIFILEDGTVWAVGNNSYGQLGDGTKETRLYPVQVKKTDGTPLIKVKSSAAGYNYTMFLLENGTIWASGINEYGQFGDFTIKQSLNPVRIN